MTQQQMARDAYAMISMTTYRPAPVVASDPIIARMDAAEADGQYDRDVEGLRRSRQGDVGGTRMICQVAVLGGDTLVTFWDRDGDGHQRRFLVDGLGRIWMDMRQGRAIRPHSGNKYAAPLRAILAARAN